MLLGAALEPAASLAMPAPAPATVLVPMVMPHGVARRAVVYRLYCSVSPAPSFSRRCAMVDPPVPAVSSVLNGVVLVQLTDTVVFTASAPAPGV